MITRFGRHIFIALLLAGISYTSSAQDMRMHRGMPPPVYLRPNGRPYNPQQRLKPIQKIKEEFISKQLALSPEQTLRFEAVYRNYQQETGAVRVLKRLNNSDAQANGADQVNKDLEYEAELFEIRKRYTQEFLKIMPPEKVSVIFKSERQFNDEAVRILKEKNGNTQSPPPNNK